MAGMSGMAGMASMAAFMVLVTMLSGGFVAGLKAGHAFNSFPLMAGKWEIGNMRSGQNDRGLALVRLDRLAASGGLEQTLRAGDATVALQLPAWADFELPEAEA